MPCRRRWTGFVALATMALWASASVACRGSSDPSTNVAPDAGDMGEAGDAEVDAGPGADWTPFCHARAQLLCAAQRDCACPIVPDQDACVATRTKACESALASAAGSDKPRLVFHAAGAERCLESTRAKTAQCGSVSTSAGAFAELDCNAVLIAPAALGEKCDASGFPSPYCAGGAGVCVRDPGGKTATCTAGMTESQPCGTGCVEGLVCNVRRQCARQGEAGAKCQANQECAFGLHCSSETETCAKPGVVGDVCSHTGECAHGLRCGGVRCTAALANAAGCDESTLPPGGCGNNGACLTTYRDRTCSPQLAEGAACKSAEDCLDGLVCSATKGCMALPKVGSPCASDPSLGPLPLCALGASCDGTSMQCLAGPGEGEPCPMNLCGPSLYCAYDVTKAALLCRRQGAVGEPCAPSAISGSTIARPCVGGAVCVASMGPGGTSGGPGTCVAAPKDGQPCLGASECAAGHECVFGGSGGVCRALPATAGVSCKEACGVGLRCVGPRGQCAATICSL